MRVTKKSVILVVCVSSAAVLGSLMVLGYQPANIIVDNVFVGTADLSLKSEQAALSTLKQLENHRLKSMISVTAKLPNGTNSVVTVTAQEFGVILQSNAAVDQALSIGKNDKLWDRIKHKFKRRSPVHIIPLWYVDERKTSLLLKRKFGKQIRIPSRSARLSFCSGAPVIIPEQIGQNIDFKGAEIRLSKTLSDENGTGFELPVDQVKPPVVSADVTGITDVIGEYSTHYSVGGNRGQNISVACDSINGVVLKPGQKFSYNEVVGPREEGHGFKLAPVIIKGKLEPGMGGGVCQTSSTLYNAVLLSGLKILRRSHHAFPVHYLPGGRDATVAYGSIDFEFANNLDSPIAISASSTNGQVSMKVYGKKSDGEIKLSRKVLREWDPPIEIYRDKDIPEGKRQIIEDGHPGLSVNLYRQFLQDGKVVKQELVSNDTYESYPRVVRLGTKKLSSRSGWERHTRYRPFATKLSVQNSDRVVLP